WRTERGYPRRSGPRRAPAREAPARARRHRSFGPRGRVAAPRAAPGRVAPEPRSAPLEQTDRRDSGGERRRAHARAPPLAVPGERAAPPGAGAEPPAHPGVARHGLEQVVGPAGLDRLVEHLTVPGGVGQVVVEPSRN